MEAQRHHKIRRYELTRKFAKLWAQIERTNYIRRITGLCLLYIGMLISSLNLLGFALAESSEIHRRWLKLVISGFVLEHILLELFIFLFVPLLLMTPIQRKGPCLKLATLLHMLRGTRHLSRYKPQWINWLIIQYSHLSHFFLSSTSLQTPLSALSACESFFHPILFRLSSASATCSITSNSVRSRALLSEWIIWIARSKSPSSLNLLAISLTSSSGLSAIA